jgi:2-alkenal reductase
LERINRKAVCEKLIMIKRVPGFLLALAFILLVIAACGTSSQAPDAATAAPTVDTHEIAAAVLAEVEAQLAQQDTISGGPAVDASEITEMVLADIASRLEQATPPPAPTVDTNELVEAVLAKVESQLEQPSEMTRVTYNDAVSTTADVGIEDALISVYQQANPAVVYIVVPSVGSGSGFVYNENGYIVTNNHVVENGRGYEVVFSNGERLEAELIGADVDSDLAVIKVAQLPDGVDPLPLAAADELQVGQFVLAIGNPFGEQGSMSLGIISGLGRSLPSQRGSASGSTYSLPQVIQTDAPINPGNSGGPLLNLEGQVVGVNSAIASTTGTNSGVGFSIPVAAVRQVVPSLVKNGEYVYPYMGASFDSEITLGERSAFGLSQTQGAYVVDVTQGSPADEAGLIPANRTTGQGGDLIVQIDDQKVKDFPDLNSYLVFHTTVGQTIEVTVLRDGEVVTLPLTLGARP